MATIVDVKQWIEHDLRRFLRTDTMKDREARTTKNPFIEVREDVPGVFRFRIYTDTNWYSIVAREGNTITSPGYLGCIAKSRKPRAGEDVHRGSDLPDGPINRDTWTKILFAIVSYEMVRVHKNQMKVSDVV